MNKKQLFFYLPNYNFNNWKIFWNNINTVLVTGMKCVASKTYTNNTISFLQPYGK